MSKKEWWVVFKHQGKELCAITAKDCYAGEVGNTKALLADEEHCEYEDIIATLEERETGGKP